MSFREGMKPIIATAEWEVRKALELEGIRMEYQYTIILDAHNVDIYGENAKQEQHCFELDGPVHLTSEKVKLRDEYLTELLEKRHFNVWHLPYTPPLSQKRLTEIVEFIKSKGFTGKRML